MNANLYTLSNALTLHEHGCLRCLSVLGRVVGFVWSASAFAGLLLPPWSSIHWWLLSAPWPMGTWFCLDV